MKKLLSIACVLAFIFSLTACSNDKATVDSEQAPTSSTNSVVAETTETQKEDAVDKYINESALNNTDNLSFLLTSVNDNEYIVANVTAPDLIKDVKTTFRNLKDGKSSVDDVFPSVKSSKIDAHTFSAEDGAGHLRFVFKDYNINIYTEESFQTWKDPSSNYESSILKEDGSFLLVKDTEKNSYKPSVKYTVWVKAKNQYIKVEISKAVTKGIPQSLKTDDAAIAAFDTLKDSLTFASVKTTTKHKNSILWEVLDLSSATVFGKANATANVANWVFANDLVSKELNANGLNLIASTPMIYSDGQVWARYDLELTDADRENGLGWQEYFYVYLSVLDEGDSYDMGKTIKEFTIGTTQFKLFGLSENGLGFALKVKTASGKEFLCELDPQGNESELGYEYVQKYLEKNFSK